MSRSRYRDRGPKHVCSRCLRSGAGSEMAEFPETDPPVFAHWDCLRAENRAATEVVAAATFGEVPA